MSDTALPPDIPPHSSDAATKNGAGRDGVNPDPTNRTLDQLQREISSVRQIVEANLRGTREVIETRLSGMDKAIELLQRTTDKLPDQIRGEVVQLKQLHDEKFSSINMQLDTRFDGIDKQFLERDKRTEQLSLADKTAIAAALQAQKEAAGAQNESNTTANGKMETTFAKLIEQMQQMMQEYRRTSEGQINDVKSRLDKGEGTRSGVQEQRTESRLTLGSVMGVVGGAIGFLSLLVAVSVILIGSSNHNGGQPQAQPAAIAVAPIAPSALAPR